jgi:saccharopine dehydrogenase (NADP+, L-glutamate forming)
MKQILIFGAGLSSTTLVKYLLDHAFENDWQVILGDMDIKIAAGKIGNHPRGSALAVNVFDQEQRNLLISNADIVISLLPASMHILLAENCLAHRKNLITASYLSGEMKMLDEEARQKGVLLLKENGRLDVFESNTGGLVAPDYDDNPWKYKFTWNPRNVILAGQKGARFLHNGKFKYIPYHKLFQRYEIIKVLDLGEFEVYPNRDSLTYKEVYGLGNISTMFRGTIRRTGFCDAWNLLVQLGATDDSYIVEFPDENMTYRDFTNSFLAYNVVDPVETKIARYLNIPLEGDLMNKLRWIGMFDRELIGQQNLTPAGILQNLLETKWKLRDEDKDMIVMQHQFEYLKGNKRKRIVSSMYLTGTDGRETAMSIAVGLPLAFAAELILLGKIKSAGVRIPITSEYYDPVLNKLEEHGIRFIEERTEMDLSQ